MEDVQAQDEEDSEYVITRFATRSFEDEFGGTIDDDLAMLQVAIVCIILFTSFALSDCKDGFVGRRVALTWGGACLRPCLKHFTACHSILVVPTHVL